jgi:TPR repeat protein
MLPLLRGTNVMRLGWLGLLLLGVAAPVTAQSVKAGIDAWSAGKHAEAVAIWRPLAARGNADAAFNLGQAYKLGRGVMVDLAQAQRFYEQAARGGHVEAQTSLGLLLFQNGNRSGALRWLGQAADAGEPRAMLVYGTALFNGDGVGEDRVRAYAFVSRAAAQGLAPARATLTEMDQLIPLDERQKGVALAQSWVAAPKVAQTKPAAGAKVAPPASGQRRPPLASAQAVPARSSSPAPAGAAGAFRIQLGAFRDRAAAGSLYARLAPRLGGAAMTLVPSGAMTRLQVGPYATRAAASAACAALRPQPCFPVAAR